MALSLDDRIRGCLVGAAVGAELGWARCVEPERFAAAAPAEMFRVGLSPAKKGRPEPGRFFIGNAAALVDAGVRAYLAAGSRATPEDFGRVFRDHEGIAAPTRHWDGLHTVQELLLEGMNPRLSGMLACPAGLVCAAMPAVGAYHFAHPDYAYLDGVELASVAQPRLGADWAGLCAAAVAAAFDPEASPERVAETVLRIAFRHARDLFYDLNRAAARAARAERTAFDADWHAGRYEPEGDRRSVWIAFNPLRFVLPALVAGGGDAERFMALLVARDFMQAPTVSAVVGGAIVGAMGGPDAFPAAWRAWAEPAARPWFALSDVVGRRVEREAAVISAADRLLRPEAGAPSLRDKVRGCILAGAIGNAMGSPVEGRFYDEIDRQHPDGITTVLDPKRLEGEDDNQMAMLLVETYIAAGGSPVMARDFGRTWCDRLNRDHFYTWCMGHGYDRIVEGWDPRIVGHWSVVTGSTVMCLEPVGVYHMGDPEFAAIDATAIALMYQRGLDVAAAAMMAATVAEAFRPDATVESVCRAAVDAAPAGPFRTFDKRSFSSCRQYVETCLEIADKYDDVRAARKELYEKCLLYDMIDPLELWGFALAMFKIAKGDVRQAAIGGTNIGRDSDTIAGRAAMLAGTLRGSANVPAEWVALFGRESLERIDRNAGRFADLVVSGRVDALRKRKAVAGAGRP